jgi:hypothetical protein
MRMFDLAGHLAFALILLSFLVRDIVWLRALSISASVAAIAYNYFAPARPLWLVIGWNVVFIAVNVAQIFLLYRERRGVDFSEVEKEIYETNFERLSPVEFMRLLRLAQWRDVEANTQLLRAGEEGSEVLLIYSGRAAVEKSGTKVTELRGGDFAGEMSFMTGLPAAATVTTLEATRYLAWEKNALRRLLDRNPSMRNALQAELSDDMAKKLARRTGLTGRFVAPEGLPEIRE